jgi:hypothetical protein
VAAGQPGPAGSVEAGGGLVEQQHRGPGGQGPVEGQVRPLGVGELDGEAAVAPHPPGDGQVLGHGEVLEQLLGLEGAGQPEAGPAVGREVVDRRPVEQDAAAGGGHEARDGLQGGGLARPVRPDEAGDGAGGQVEVKAGHHVGGAEADPQAPDLEGGGHRRRHPVIPAGASTVTAMRPRPLTSSCQRPMSSRVKTSPFGTSSPPTTAPAMPAMPPR